MDITLLKRATIHSLVLMVSVVVLSYLTNLYQMVNVEAGSQKIAVINADYTLMTNNIKPGTDLLDYVPSHSEASADTKLTGIAAIRNRIAPEILQKLSNNFLIIEKPKGNYLNLKLDDVYVNSSIKIDITGMTDNIITSDMITRIRGNEIYTGDPVFTESVTVEVDEDDGTTEEIINRDYGRDLSHGITITTQENAVNRLYSAQVTVSLDSVYESFIYEDEMNYYIDLKRPSDIYDKIVVIDAGHGGKDGGALSKDKKYFEKNINLDILLRLKELLDESDIKAYFTRTADETVYLRPRAELVNAVDADYFISIHCNANEVTSPNGMEVLYYDNEFKGVKAKDLAFLFSKELEKTVNLSQKGIVRRNYEDLYIMDHSLVPTVLLEIGYMTNKGDLDYLTDEENRAVIANAIFNGILRAYNELPVRSK
jgi:N-acetylmuramoyl-L-alanine amidase